MPVVEVVTDPFEIGRQKFKERERMSGTHENTKKVEKHVAMNMKLIPEGAAPFLKVRRCGFHHRPMLLVVHCLVAAFKHNRSTLDITPTSLLRTVA